MSLTIHTVDSFSNEPFRGNPAAVCILSEPQQVEWMQKLAREMNLSETAFLLRDGDQFNLRWFTPAVEVDLCGHATLASAHVLWETGELPIDQPAVFSTRSGILKAERRDDWIVMDFPAELETAAEIPEGLVAALGINPVYVGKNRFDYLIELESADAVRNVSPSISQLATIPARGFIVTARDDSGEYDFVSRFFAPACGVPEDPVCGSAHCCLGPFWSGKLDKPKMMAYQASARGGVVGVEIVGDRVHLSGQAVTVMKAELVDSIPDA